VKIFFKKKYSKVLHGRDLSGKVAIVTGCNTGIGFETAYSLSRHGCKVIMACRNIAETKKAIETIKTRKNTAAELCFPLEIDLSSLSSVKSFADNIKKKIK